MSKKRLVIIMSSLIIWMICIFSGYTSYEVCDDTAMNLIAAGAWGAYPQFLINNSGIFMGMLLQLLYTLFPHINCYLWLYLICDLLAVITICFILSDDQSLRVSTIISIGIGLLFAGEFYIHLTYTKSAALYGITGMTALLWQCRKQSKERSILVLSYFLIAIGFWSRWKAFVLSIPVVIGVEIINILFRKIVKKEKIDIKSYYITIIPLVICLISLFADVMAYRLTDGWEEFRKTDNLLVEMRDYNRYSFSASEDEYLDNGISENDFAMMKHYRMHNDPNYFNSERLELVKSIGKKYEPSSIRIEIPLIKDLVKEILYVLSSKAIGTIFIMIVLIAFMLADMSTILQILYIAMLTAAETYYMICLNRVLWRAEICVWVAAVVLGGYLLSTRNQSENTSTQKHTIADRLSYISLAIVIVLTVVIKSFVVDNSRLTNGDNNWEAFEQLRQADGFFVCADLAQFGMLLGAKNIYDIDTSYRNYYSNLVDIGGAGQSPSGLYFANQHGIDNPVEDLINGDKIYFYGQEEPRQVLVKFMEEKYGPGLIWEPVTIDGVEAWKCSKK